MSSTVLSIKYREGPDSHVAYTFFWRDKWWTSKWAKKINSESDKCHKENKAMLNRRLF